MAPALTLTDKYHLLGGRVSERAIVAGAVPWLCGPLVETETAHARLADWVAAGGLTRPAPVLRHELAYFGDEPVLPAVLRALAALAPPARDHVLESAIVLVTGHSTNGWTAALPTGKPSAVLLAGYRAAPSIEQTALHEFAHVWLEPTPSVATRTAGEVDLMHAATVEGWAPQIHRMVNSREHRANALAAVWRTELERDR